MRSDPVTVVLILIIDTLSKNVRLFWYPKNIPSRYCPGKVISQSYCAIHVWQY